MSTISPDLQRDAWHCLDAVMPADWLDSNNHVNVQFYYRMAAEAVYEMMDNILEGAQPGAPPPLFFTLESRMFYKAELFEGDRVRVYIRPLLRTGKVLTCLIQIYRVEPNPALSAECWWVGAYVDPGTRRIAPLHEAARVNFDAKLAEVVAEPYTPPNFPPRYRYPEDAAATQTFATTIEPEWRDRMGHVGIEFFMYIFFKANLGYIGQFDPDFAVQASNNWGPFALESSIVYKAELNIGDPVRVTTRPLGLSAKVYTWRHELWRGEGEPVLAATYDHSNVFCELTERKALPYPRVFLEAVARLHGVDVPA